MQETQETQVESLGQGDPLEEEMAIHSSILACLENPTDIGAWWPTVHRVTESWTWLVNWALPHLSTCCLKYIPHLNLFFSIEIWEVCTESLVCLILSVLMEKAMAPHSSTLAWKIPWREEPGGLQFMGSLRVGHDWATSLSLFTFMHWRRKWQPIPVFLPGESQGRGSLMGCCLWGCTESDTTEAT